MVPLILDFVACARAAGLRVSTGEVLDCLSQAGRIDPLEESQFCALLRANMAKSRLEQERFERIYHLYFHELRREIGDSSVSIAAQSEEIGAQVRAMDPADPIPGAVADFLDGDPTAYLQLLRQIDSEGDSQRLGPGANLGSLVRRLPVLAALERARAIVDGYLETHRRKLHWETRREIERHLSQRLASARRLLTETDRSTVAPRPFRKNISERRDQLSQRAFSGLSPAEVEQMRQVVARLVRKLKDAIGLRHAARTRGLLDVPKTLRRAGRYQGVPLELRHRRRPPRKGRVMALCDLSGSVWSAARFMLNMLYALQDCFDRVRSFVFVAGLVEVTDFFDRYDIDRAIAKVLTDTELAYEAATDYGLTLRQFRAAHMDAVNKKTTVIIIGDGRSNYGNPEVGIVAQIRDRCRRLIWLNPESEAFWHTGDSEMRAYMPLCNEVRPCQNLDQLSDFIRDLVL
ncbi:MAG TPA: VWA domain-containing protein [Desulfobacteraceae bacterium]|nr:VWA domain-containing protein [Deltaproteobacteria bacterium]MBW2356978.1 VWA domain-containing protein [Deltaproteobacteria bacterium]HDI60502.1 VWA domain-containing protein [Desulfobacteraceae bacterium]